MHVIIFRHSENFWFASFFFWRQARMFYIHVPVQCSWKLKSMMWTKTLLTWIFTKYYFIFFISLSTTATRNVVEKKKQAWPGKTHDSQQFTSTETFQRKPKTRRQQKPSFQSPHAVLWTSPMLYMQIFMHASACNITKC